MSPSTLCTVATLRVIRPGVTTMIHKRPLHLCGPKINEDDSTKPVSEHCIVSLQVCSQRKDGASSNRVCDDTFAKAALKASTMTVDADIAHLESIWERRSRKVTEKSSLEGKLA